MTKLSPLSLLHPNNQVGLFSARGGIVTDGALGANFTLPENWVMLRVGMGGNLVLQDMEGNPMPFLSLGNGAIVFALASKVLTGATIGGVPYTTTCQKITWHTPCNVINE